MQQLIVSIHPDLAEPASTRFIEGTLDVTSYHVGGYYLLEPVEDIDGYEHDEFEVIDADGSFDIAPAVIAALVYATPYVILCKEDCAGLCPRCGADLNEGPCSCGETDEIDPLNPFAVLKDLEFGDE